MNRDMLMFAIGDLVTEERELILTVPVEAFDYYADWIQESTARVFDGDIRVIDEATACILGYSDGVRDGSIYTVLDFGGGTLDISIVKVDFNAEGAWIPLRDYPMLNYDDPPSGERVRVRGASNRQICSIFVC